MTADKRRELTCEYRLKIAKKAPEELWASWQKFFPVLTDYVRLLYHRMEIFKDLVEVVRANPATLSPPVLFNWIRDNYVVAECMAIRRMMDVDDRSTSLGRLLREIEIRPELVNKTQYRALVARKLSERDADESFERWLGVKVDQITPEMAAADVERLEVAEANIRKLVNKRFAHASPFTEVVTFDVFGDLEKAIEEVDQIVVKYDGVIYGGFLSTAHSTKLNWKQPLGIAWIAPENDAPSYSGPRHREVQ